MSRNSWATRFGFYLVAIGSACGLGNLWRFPYVVGENGGGAFVLLYVLLALLVGLPLLVGELVLGKSSRRSVLLATEGLTADFQTKFKAPFKFLGWFSVLMCLIVLSYYAVISGWVLHFLTQFTLNLFSVETNWSTSIQMLQKNGWLQVGLASAHLLFVLVVVLRGVQEGLERFVGAIVPFFVLLLCLLMVKSLALPSSAEAVRFLFYPDFSKLSWASMAHALGHVLFTLSIGFGTMVTFGSYLRDTEHIPTAAVRVTLLDTGLSLVAGLLIFPIALQASQVPLTDPGLLFDALPRFLGETKGGALFGFSFFLFLYLAALGASIGLLEVIVSNGVDKLRMDRVTVGWSSALLALVLSLGPALSDSVLRQVKLGSRGLLESLDAILINWILPLIAFGFSLALSWGLSKHRKQHYFIDNSRIESTVLFSHWEFALRYLVPGIILFALLLQTLGLLY